MWPRWTKSPKRKRPQWDIKDKVMVICGPTASGKTLLSIELAKKINGQTIKLSIKCGSNGKTFGSVTSKEISEELLKKNIDIDKKKIDLKEPIKAVGTYEVVARIYPEISAKFFVEINSI